MNCALNVLTALSSSCPNAYIRIGGMSPQAVTFKHVDGAVTLTGRHLNKLLIPLPGAQITYRVLLQSAQTPMA